MNEKEKVRLSLYVSAEEKKALQRLAEKHMRSMASEARAIIVERINEGRD